jgi:hypothetical protein
MRMNSGDEAIEGIYVKGSFPELVISPKSDFWMLDDEEKIRVLNIFLNSMLSKTLEQQISEYENEQRRGAKHWTGRRKKIFVRDGSVCRYCGKDCVDNETIDHVIPRSQGGTDAEGNLVIACWSCNSHKHARTPQEAGMELR